VKASYSQTTGNISEIMQNRDMVSTDY